MGRYAFSNRLAAWLCAGMLLSGLWPLSGCSGRDRDIEILPESALKRLSLRSRERPRSYTLITDTNLLSLAGLRRNPDYVSRKGDREAVLRVGGSASFLALYGREDVVRLIINGVYFRNTDDAMKYAAVQETRERRVLAFRRDTGSGLWLIFIARDPELAYDEDEMKAIRKALKRYQKRLRLAELFDQLNDLPVASP